jgi:hypothetical protein
LNSDLWPARVLTTRLDLFQPGIFLSLSLRVPFENKSKNANRESSSICRSASYFVAGVLFSRSTVRHIVSSISTAFSAASPSGLRQYLRGNLPDILEW